MDNSKFSLIVPISQAGSDVSPIFSTTDEDTELIIIDKFYSPNSKKVIADRDGYSSIIYAPPFGLSFQNLPIGEVRSLNTGYMFAQNDWIILTDRILEFRDNFFNVLREDINEFRDVHRSNKFIVAGQTLFRRNSNIRWKNYIIDTNARFQFIGGEYKKNIVTFLCLSRDLFKSLNGLDERYNIGSRYFFDNLILRAMVTGDRCILDQYLMAYDHLMDIVDETPILSHFLYKSDEIEISRGKRVAYNPFNIDQFRDNFLLDRPKFEIKN